MRLARIDTFCSLQKEALWRYSVLESKKSQHPWLGLSSCDMKRADTLLLWEKSIEDIASIKD
jgi:hypothetical protein